MVAVASGTRGARPTGSARRTRSARPARPAARAAASAAGSSRASAQSSQPSWLPAPGTGWSAASRAITSGPKSALSRARNRSRKADQCARRSGSSPARARSAATATACESASASGAGGMLPSTATIPPPCPSPARVEAVPPALLGQPARVPARTAAHQPGPVVEGPLQPAAGRGHRRRQLGLQRGVPGRGQQDQEPGGGVRGAVVVQRPGAHRPPRLDQPVRRDRAPLVQDLPRLLVDLRVVDSALPGGQRPQRRRRDVRARRSSCSAKINESRPNRAWNRPGSPASTGNAEAYAQPSADSRPATAASGRPRSDRSCSASGHPAPVTAHIH